MCREGPGGLVAERSVRRWLRAVEHRAQTRPPSSPGSSKPPDYRPRKKPTLTPVQLEGWRALQAMVARQTSDE